MQNIGFLLCIYPALERLYLDNPQRNQVVERHLELENTHPAMGPLLVGLTGRMERDLDAAAVVSYPKRVIAALAAYGDRLFWSNLRRLTAVAGVLLWPLLSRFRCGEPVSPDGLRHAADVLPLRVFSRGWRDGPAVLQG